jgi:hypothetical protein
VLIEVHVHLPPRRRASLMNVFGAVHDPRYRMKGLDDRARELPEGVTGHSDRIVFG